MKIISWNVNGVRAVLKKGFLEFLEAERPEIICIQEVKISDAAKDEAAFDFPGYREYWNCALRPGYSGTATLIRENLDQPLNLDTLGLAEFDDEGRTQILEFPDFYLINCYFPNANGELSRLDYKLAFNEALEKKIKKLELKKPVILTGDYNVA
ncbi:exodeoxyribonuclease III, partial [Candidatus Falkowbacteria bacterium]|nr:exodeoxyribonuclease III [Candidatus Falkowbacteria bacterium]